MPRITLCLLLTVLITLASCSFDYRDEALSGEPSPEMVMINAEASRYENAEKSVFFSAAVLEVYDSDRVWAAESVQFVEYSDDGTGTVEIEGGAGILLIDEKDEVYSLGEQTSFFVREDGIRMNASDLQWAKKRHCLYSADSGIVEIIKDDGSTIRGTGFFADTLSRSYLFKRDFSGVIVTTFSDDEPGEDSQ